MTIRSAKVEAAVRSASISESRLSLSCKIQRESEMEMFGQNQTITIRKSGLTQDFPKYLVQCTVAMQIKSHVEALRLPGFYVRYR